MTHAPAITSLGTGTAVLKSSDADGNSVFRSILAGANCTVSLVGDDIVVASTASGGGEVNTATGLGIGATIVGTKTGTVLGFKNILQGSGIAVSSDATDLTISANAIDLNSLTDVDTSSLTTGQILRYNGSLWVVQSLTTTSVGAGVSLIKLNTAGGSTVLRSIVAGSGVSIDASNPDVLTISATGTGEANTASNVGAGLGLFKQKAGVNLEFKTLVAGTNISLTNPDANTITINSTGGGGSTTITTDSGCPQLTAVLTGSNYLLSSRGADTIRIGANSGGATGTLNFGGISIGDNSGKTTGVENLYFGPSSGGGTGSKNSGMALGILSGYNSLGTRATAIGFQSGFNATGDQSVAIGAYSGYSGTAANCLSLGAYANYAAPAQSCIVLNATGSSLNGSGAGLFVAPVANKTLSNLVCYDATTKEMSYKLDFQALRVVNTAGRNSLSGLTAGSVVYNSDGIGTIDLWNGSVWRSI